MLEAYQPFKTVEVFKYGAGTETKVRGYPTAMTAMQRVNANHLNRDPWMSPDEDHLPPSDH
ncbi:hypothetical protein [Desulfurococcus mucosus]|uniref:Uncharacterized protein n=1 Tax=Desulfurococcus mucosus (strain ATCC 35584 / DSM 2162 / JCM 9187 / O7/1) TaxID=765177 RepID=E8R747_DESM0|nr:hypothetical protein [Desulfurococcus mucosus]ADV65512.1 hypothetical protein Desmu_1216 [Desulfurococcus mucosus DSM 2162]